MWDKAVVEFRTDTVVRGTLPDYLRLTESLVLPSHARHVGKPIAYYTSDIGMINLVIALWGYDSLADYETRTAALDKDPDAQKFLAETTGIISDRVTRLTRRAKLAGFDHLSAAMQDKPVIDFRTYKMRRGGMDEFMRAAVNLVLPVNVRHTGAPLGYFIDAAGDPDQVTHLWGYDSLADMETRRVARNKDPDWPKYAASSRGLILKQETMVLRRVNLKGA